jgi:excisionase family DNA binding protein
MKWVEMYGSYADVRSAARYAGVAAVTIRAWITAGRLKSTLIGGAHLIQRDDLESAMFARKHVVKKKSEK